MAPSSEAAAHLTVNILVRVALYCVFLFSLSHLVLSAAEGVRPSVGYPRVCVRAGTGVCARALCAGPYAIVPG